MSVNCKNCNDTGLAIAHRGEDEDESRWWYCVCPAGDEERAFDDQHLGRRPDVDDVSGETRLPSACDAPPDDGDAPWPVPGVCVCGLPGVQVDIDGGWWCERHPA